MLAELGGRDRLVMSGLVVLGLLTVIAGVISGRSTADYVLKEDARDAASSWAVKLDSLAKQGTPRTLDSNGLRSDHLSKLDGMALLDPDKSALAVGGDLTAGGIENLLTQKEVAAAFNEALAQASV